MMDKSQAQSAPKYTRGPWRQIVAEDEISIFGETRVVPVAEIFHIDDTSRKNALLIAAAPDLLTALEETTRAAARLLQAIDRCCDKDTAQIIAMYCHEHEGFGVRANAAIAKATGDVR